MSLPNDTPPPNEKKLRIGSFSLHAARGLVRDQRTRRMTMFGIVIVALVASIFSVLIFDPIPKVLSGHWG